MFRGTGKIYVSRAAVTASCTARMRIDPSRSPCQCLTSGHPSAAHVTIAMRTAGTNHSKCLWDLNRHRSNPGTWDPVYTFGKKLHSSRSQHRDDATKETEVITPVNGAPQPVAHQDAHVSTHANTARQPKLTMSAYNRIIHRRARVGDMSGVMFHLKCLMDNGLQPDVVTYNTILNACAQSGDGEAAVKWFNTMTASGIPPSTTSYNTVLNAYAQRGDATGAVKWVEIMATSDDCAPSATTYSTVIHAHAKCGDAVAATAWFDKMTENGFQPTVPTYSSVMNAYAKRGDADNAVHWFNLMVERGLQPTETTYSTIINAFAQVGNSTAAVDWFNAMLTKGIHPNVVSYSAVINSFVQSKDCANTVHWFDKMVVGGVKPNVVSYGSVINAFADAGDSVRALEWLDRMAADSVRPTRTVYNTVLKACWLAAPADVPAAFRIADKMMMDGISINDYSMAMLLRCCARSDPPLPRVAEQVFQKHIHIMDSSSNWQKLSLALRDAVGTSRARELLKWSRQTTNPLPPPRATAAQTGAMYTPRRNHRS